MYAPWINIYVMLGPFRHVLGEKKLGRMFILDAPKILSYRRTI